jgi:hypothetical protein
MITLERELKWKRVGTALAMVFCLVGIGWTVVRLPAILFPPVPELTNDIGMPFKLIPAGWFGRLRWMLNGDRESKYPSNNMLSMVWHIQ